LLQLGKELEEASWVAGGSWFYTFRRVVLPILTPVLLTVGLVAFISATRNIAGIALLVTNQNRPLAMLQLDYMVDGRYEAAAVVGVIVTVLSSGVAALASLFGLRVGIRT
jgi:iron(III) transport system permease protein